MESFWLKPLFASELARVFETNKLVVVHCWASWNGHDRRFILSIRNVEPEYVDSVKFYGLDIDTADGQELSSAWDVRSVPALVAFRYGTRIETTIGFRIGEPFEPQVRELLDRWTRRSMTKPHFE
jgi:thiol-disulfide isomerase/thioredoxin